MADRSDFLFRQVLASGELDEAFDDVEDAERNLLLDYGLGLTDLSTTNGGILEGLTVTLVPATFSVTVALGTARDDLGRRIRVLVAATVNLSNDGEVAIGGGGVAGGNSTTPGVGQERWISLFIEFERLLSDPRIDGTGATVQYARDESFQFVIVQSGDAAAPIADGARPALQAGRILLADIRRSPAAVIEVVQDLPNTAQGGAGRRQVWFRRQDAPAPVVPVVRAGAGFPIRGISHDAGGLRGILDLLLGFYNDHVRRDASTADFHFAKNVGYENAGTAWANAEAFFLATMEADNGAPGVDLGAGLQLAIDEIVGDLAATGAVSGADRLGVGAEAGAGRPAGAVGAADAIVAGTLTAGLIVLLDAVNEAVRLTGDTMTGNLLPNVDGRDLGSAAQRWDAFIQALDVENIISNVGTGGAKRTLGGVAAVVDRFDLNAHLVNLNGTPGVEALLTFGVDARTVGDIVPSVTLANSLGTSGLRYGAVWAASVDASVGKNFLSSNAVAVDALQLDVPVDNSTTGDILVSRSKFNTTHLRINPAGRCTSARSIFRDDFLYRTSAGLQTVWDDSFTSPAEADVTAQSGPDTDESHIGTVRLRSTLNADIAHRAAIQSAVIAPGAHGDSSRRRHFICRIWGTGSNTNRRIHVGWADSYDIAVGTGEPAEFIGFRVSPGANDILAVVRSGGDENAVDTTQDLAVGGQTFATLELQVVDTTRVFWRVIGSTGVTSTGLLTLVAPPAALPTAARWGARLGVSNAADGPRELHIDYVDIYMS